MLSVDANGQPATMPASEVESVTAVIADAVETATQEKADKQAESKTIVMPTAAIKRIRTEERNKGEASAKEAFEAEAKALGYNSMEHMLSALKAKSTIKKPNASTAKLDEAESDSDTQKSDSSKLDADKEKKLAILTNQNQRLIQAKRQAEQIQRVQKESLQQLQRQLDAKEAEYELRLTAVNSGISNSDNVDFAMHRYNKHIVSAKDKAVDATEFFAGLRATFPQLFNAPAPVIKEKPATTTAQTATQSPAKAQTPIADKKQDVLTNEQYAQRLRELGITDPRFGSSG